MSKTVNIENNAGNVYIGPSPECRVDSVVNELLKQLASQPFHFQCGQRKAPSATILKIEHNHIQTKKYIIRQYLNHSSGIEAAYNGIDSVIPFGKQIVLQSLNDLYYAALDHVGIEHLTGDIDIGTVRKNSEFILDFIIQKLRNFAFESKNSLNLKEQIETGINVIVAHAFIECVIFETPEHDS